MLTVNHSASTATIVRIPYLVSLSNKADFLYATTNVAIWSACETGLAITAASAATLRPLFQKFLSRKRMFGNSVAGRQAHSISLWPRPCPNRPPAAARYTRSPSRAGIIDPEFGVGANDWENKRTGTATTAEAPPEDEEEAGGKTFLDSRDSSRSGMRMVGAKNHIVNLMR